MKQCLATFIFLAVLFTTHSQESKAATDNVNTRLELKLDSIELRIAKSRMGIDTSRYLHYTVRNISKDTLTYVTNSCFYYNHCVLKTEHSEFDINKEGGCNFNSLTSTAILPRASISRTEQIISGLSDLPVGEQKVSFFVPLVKDKKSRYRVDGRNIVENEEQLIFNGKTRVVRIIIDNRKFGGGLDSF